MICIALWLYGEENISNILFKDFFVITSKQITVKPKTAFFPGIKPAGEKFKTAQA